MFENQPTNPIPSTKSNKKTILLIIFILLGLIIIAGGTIWLTSSNIFQNKPSTNNTLTKESADNLKNQAIEALKANNNNKAKDLLQQAKDQYTTLNDTDNIVDTNAQIWLIDNPSVKEAEL